MVYKKNQIKASIQENEQGIFKIKRDCLDTDIKCNKLSDRIDILNMSRNIYDVFIFNGKILNITNEMWMKVFKTVSLKEKFRGRAVCYNFLNEENCFDLNIHYYNFTSELVSYQKLYNSLQKHDDYLDFVKNVLNSLDKFLFSSFTSLENDIEHLLIEVYMINKSKEQNPFKLYRKKSVGSEVNQSILNYFKSLKQIIHRFQIVDAPLELAEKKKIIEFKIDKAFEKKLNYLRKHKSNDSNTDVKNKTVAKNNSYIDFYYEPNAISSSDFINQNFEIIEHELPTKEFNTTAYIKPRYLELDYSLQHNLSDKINTSNNNGENLTAAINYVLFGSICALIFSIIIYVFYLVKKLKAKKKQPSSNEIIQHKNFQLTLF